MGDRELSVERRIAAPIEEVWLTIRDRFEEWFCPRPWRAEARDIEWRAGGRSLVVMHGPNGEEVPNEGVILEYDANRRFVFTDAFKAGWQPSGPFMVGLFAIAPDGEGTRFTATARHWIDETLASFDGVRERLGRHGRPAQNIGGGRRIVITAVTQRSDSVGCAGA